MKRVSLLVLSCVLVFLSLYAQNQNEAPEPPAPVFKFEKEEVNFGNIPYGAPVTTEFEFRNIGKQPLVIKDVRRNCNCTSVSFPREPIMPNKTGVIKAEYDASEEGVFNKKLTVLANTQEGMHALRIKGTVVR